ncbi:hypothetical protein [Pseudomonas sp. KK4]|uniref:SpaN/EivJ family type III secretion system needle length determinant n=1 Tax=Pseudomonas sp. KK4 TaxID=1855729 RepID=UPI00097BF86A|nr:hypothetical protein [Pseudomonas sp. KK4]
MSDVAVVSPLPIQPADGVSEDPAGELLDRLVPVREDELPQGVLELLAPLMMRHRPLTDMDRGPLLQTMLPAIVAVEYDEAQQSPAPVAVPCPNPQPPSSKPVQPGAYVAAAPVFDAAFFKVAQAPLTDRPVDMPNPSLAETVTPADALEFVGQRSPALPIVSHRPFVSPAPTPAVPQPPPMPETVIDALPNPAPGLLQVPFDNGIASGQVTIRRMADEPARTLQLSPSNALVFEQLKVSLEQVREPAWHLTDSDDQQQRQGSRQAPGDEQDEEAGQGA